MSKTGMADDCDCLPPRQGCRHSQQPPHGHHGASRPHAPQPANTTISLYKAGLNRHNYRHADAETASQPSTSRLRKLHTSRASVPSSSVGPPPTARSPSNLVSTTYFFCTGLCSSSYAFFSITLHSHKPQLKMHLSQTALPRCCCSCKCWPPSM